MRLRSAGSTRTATVASGSISSERTDALTACRQVAV